MQHDAVQLFYKERIETARMHAGMKSLVKSAPGALTQIEEMSTEDKSSIEMKKSPTMKIAEDVTVSTELTHSAKVSPHSSDDNRANSTSRNSH